MSPGTAPASVLIQSSPTTHSWLEILRDRLPHLEYRETRYWASFRAPAPNRVVAYLNPSKQGIRVFLALDADDGPNLLPTPSSSDWAARFPSIFSVAGVQDLDAAITHILKSEARTNVMKQGNTLPRPDHCTAEELLPETVYAEGAVRRLLVNAYERNRKARQKCLGHFGKVCAVCGFSFEARYGPSLNGYIHVHHLVPIAQIGKEYRLDPLRDLRPVCPNCHAVIHRREPPFSIEEVKQMIKGDDE